MRNFNAILPVLDDTLRFVSERDQNPRIDGRRHYELLADALENEIKVSWPEFGVSVLLRASAPPSAWGDAIIKAFTAHDKALADAKLARNPLRRLQPRVRRAG